MSLNYLTFFMGFVLGYKIALQADCDEFDSHKVHHVAASYNSSITDFDSVGLGAEPRAASSFLLCGRGREV